MHLNMKIHLNRSEYENIFFDYFRISKFDSEMSEYAFETENTSQYV